MANLVQVSQPDPSADPLSKLLLMLFGGSPQNQAQGLTAPLELPRTEVLRLVNMLMQNKGKFIGSGAEAAVRHLGEVPGVGGVVGKTFDQPNAVSGLPWADVVKLAQKLNTVAPLMHTQAGNRDVVLQRAVAPAQNRKWPYGVSLQELLRHIVEDAKAKGITYGDAKPDNFVYGDIRGYPRRVWGVDVGGIRPYHPSDEFTLNPAIPDPAQIMQLINGMK